MACKCLKVDAKKKAKTLLVKIVRDMFIAKFYISAEYKWFFYIYRDKQNFFALIKQSTEIAFKFNFTLNLFLDRSHCKRRQILSTHGSKYAHHNCFTLKHMNYVHELCFISTEKQGLFIT